MLAGTGSKRSRSSVWPSLLPSPSLPWASTQAPYHTPYVLSDHSTHTHTTQKPPTHIYSPVHTLYTSHTKSKQTVLLTLKHCLTYQPGYVFTCLPSKLVGCRRRMGGGRGVAWFLPLEFLLNLFPPPMSFTLCICKATSSAPLGVRCDWSL